MSELLQATGLYRSFGHGRGQVQVLRGIDLQVSEGEMVAIVGASGSGKTTLLQILGTLDRPDAGELFFAGQDLTRLSETGLARHRNRMIGFIFQFHHLLPEFTALENVLLPGLIGGRNRQEMLASSRRLLEKVDLGHRLHHRPGELSGGEQQRVALARALIMKPRLLLADEPTGNLDSRAGHRVFELLKALCKSLGMAVIMVTHNQGLARAMDRRLTLADGILGTTRP